MLLKSYIHNSILRYSKKKSLPYYFYFIKEDEMSIKYVIQFELAKGNNIHTTDVELSFQSDILKISFSSPEIRKGFDMIDIIKFYNEISIMISHLQIDFLTTYQKLYVKVN